LIATLCAAAESHLQLQTPESGDDALEDFIEHHPTDSELPVIFEKLDQLYAAERQASGQELNRWATDPAQPRRALAQWYFAKSELRAGRREAARQAFAKLRDEHAKFPALAPGLVQFAELEIEDRRFEDALAILNDALALAPPAIWSQRITLLMGRAEFQARQFDKAAQTFEQVANRSPALRRDSLFNASLAWLQQNDKDRFLADTKELANNGATEVFPGYHKQGRLTPEDGMYHNLPEELVDLTKGQKLDLGVGDVAMFGAFTPHRSAPNRTTNWRRQLYLSYTADADGGDLRDKHYDFFKKWLVERYAEYGKTGVWFR
jgi:tetratricopeptide (TPR) repeat protein